jgi:hypothetical protein
VGWDFFAGQNFFFMVCMYIFFPTHQMDKTINQADKLMRQNGAIQISKTNSWTLREIKYFFNKHGIFFSQNYPSTIPPPLFSAFNIK